VSLLDHFHPPLSERRPWESFHTTWASAMADLLNREVLPPGYIALEQIHAGPMLEIDVATFGEPGMQDSAGGGVGTATVTRSVWTPAVSPLVLPAVFPPGSTIQIVSSEGGRTVVAAIELVSPANKDRAGTRRLFAAKCATYLSRGLGLIIIDVVSSRHGNLHNEVMELLGHGEPFRMPADQHLYAAAYRPLRVADSDRIESWPVPLALGDALPTLPLSLDAELCVPVDLDAAYVEACQRRRIEEALE